MTPKVAVVVLNWNNAPDTLACLQSLSMLCYPDYTVLVVDNGSTDDSVAQICSRFPEIEVLQTSTNLGYAEGNNVGIRYVLKQEPAYVCILNNDTILAPNCLQALVSEAESNPDIGMVGPKKYFFEPSDMVYAAGGLIDWRRGTVVHRGMWQRESEVGPLYADGPTDVDFIDGCCVLVKRQLIERIGLLDPRYYLNFEDADWCVRARRAGYRARYTPDAVLWHKLSASLGMASPRKTYYMTRNALLFFWTHLDGWRRWRAIAHIVKRNVGHIAVWTLKPKYRQTARAKRDANILALRDALLGCFGKMGADVERICQTCEF
jgi:GT2 family glycosyltransferase